jgi:hypothetical protein
MEIEESDDDGWFLMQLTQPDLVYLEMGLEYIKERLNYDDYDNSGRAGLNTLEGMIEELVDRKIARRGQLTREEQEHDYSNLILSVRENENIIS